MEEKIDLVNKKMKKDDKGPRGRSWVFTWNNYPLDVFEILQALEGECRFLIAGKEVGEVCGTPHLQGYITFKNARYGSGVRKILPGCRLDLAKGTEQNNIDYCCKGEQPKEEWERLRTKGPSYGLNACVMEIGERKHQGLSARTMTAVAELKAGNTTLLDIFVEDPDVYTKHWRGLHMVEDSIYEANAKGRREPPKTTWFYGPTGSGKSKLCFEELEDKTSNEFYVWIDDKGWWDRYKQQDIVILNDFRGGITYNHMLNMCDMWYHEVPRRGRKPMPFVSKEIRISSSKPPDMCYKNVAKEDKIAQLLRRISVVYIGDGKTTEEEYLAQIRDYEHSEFPDTEADTVVNAYLRASKK